MNALKRILERCDIKVYHSSGEITKALILTAAIVCGVIGTSSQYFTREKIEGNQYSDISFSSEAMAMLVVDSVFYILESR